MLNDLTRPLLHEHNPGLCGDVGSVDEQLLSSVHRAAGWTEAVDLRKFLTGALG